MRFTDSTALAQVCIEGQHYMETVHPEDGSPWYRKCVRCSATRAQGASHITEPAVEVRRELRAV
jgi:hypothetical protein